MLFPSSPLAPCELLFILLAIKQASTVPLPYRTVQNVYFNISIFYSCVCVCGGGGMQMNKLVDSVVV